MRHVEVSPTAIDLSASSAGARAAARGEPAPRRALAAAFLGILIGPFDVGLVGVGLSSISARFGGDVTSGQLVVLVYLALITASYVPFGRLADRRSPASVLRLGLLLVAAGALLVAFAGDFALVLVGRALQGAGAAAAVSGSQAVAFAASGAARAGRSLGLVHVAVGLGMLAGPVVGGLVVERSGWQAAFLIEPPIALVAILLARGPRPAHHVRDASSVIALLRRPGLTAGLVLAVLTFTAMSANMFLVPYLLQRPLALAPSSAGLLMAIVPAGILVGALPAGALADRYGSRWPSTAGLALVALGILGFALASSVEVVGLALATYGLGAALFQSPNNLAVLAAAPPGGLGLASGLLGTSRQLGQILGVLLSGSLIRISGGLDAPSAYPLAFAVLAGLAGLALVFAYRQRR